MAEETKELNKKTISTIFLVPPLRINRDDLKRNNFINAFVSDKNKEVNYTDCCLLLFKPDKPEVFKDFVDGEYERTLSIIDDYDYGKFTVLVYTLNDYFKKDFELIKQGKYSKCSDEFKEQFPKVIKVMSSNGLFKEEVTLQYRIFNKTEDLQKYWEDKIGVNFKDEYEVWSKFSLEEETLDIEKLKELI